MLQHIDPDRLYLFCVAYAGGTAAAVYGRWARMLPASVRVVPLDLAGHGRRTPEPFHDSIEAAVKDLAATVAPVARQARYAFYGHSMGTSVVYELVQQLADTGLPAPQALFLSGSSPPHYPHPQRHIHLLSDELFLAEIHRLGGTPASFFETSDLVRAFLPVLRSDYRLIDCYTPRRPVHVTSAHIIVLQGESDPLVTEHEARLWRDYTHGVFKMHIFCGDHFFINQHAEAICRLVADTPLSSHPEGAHRRLRADAG
ncbi:MAG: thioesterase II family protein [Betaproteobacteria bacterium]